MKILMDTHAFLWFIEGDNNRLFGNCYANN